MPQSRHSPCDCCAGTGPPCARAASERALTERLRTELAEATAQACAAYQDNARLVRVLSIIAQPSAPETLSDEVLFALSQTYNADLACIVRLVGDRLVVVGACGIPEDDQAFIAGWLAGETAIETLQGSEAVGKGHLELGGADDIPAPLASLGIRSAAWVPVRSDTTSTSTLLVLYRRSSQAFTPTELRGLESVATRLAVAVEARERSVLADRLARSGHRLTRHLNLSSLYRDASALLRELLRADDAWVIAIDGESARRPWPSSSKTDRLPSTWPRPASALPGWPTLKTGDPYRTASSDSSVLTGPTTRPTALMCVPIMSDRRPVALLYAARDTARPFARDDVEAATTFARYLHSAMINAELYQALKDNEAALRHRASHDPLTGLANRDLANEYLGDALARDDPSSVGLLFCDLDKFKAINDRLGHAIGDELLCLVAERLRSGLRRGDLLARLGGDEFLFVLDGITTMDDLTEIGDRVAATMDQPFMLRGEAVFVTVSVGAVRGERGHATSMSLLRDADAAMYAAKGKGAGLVQVFDDRASRRSRERLDLRSDLQSALDQHQLSVHYQPIFDLLTGEIVAFEALLRWLHPVRGPIPPDQFIPLAEESGEIIPIGNWVLAEACRDLATWRRTLHRHDLTISVNLSPFQLRNPAHAAHMLDLILQAEIDPTDVSLEITESDSIQAEVAQFITPLKAAGVHISLDDFGTAYSYLGDLRRLPVDCLKIDRSFVSGLAADQGPRNIEHGVVRGILAIADSLKLIVVAEGIETAEQRAELAALGCHLGQGFLLSKAVPAADAIRLLQSGLRLPRLTTRLSTTESTDRHGTIPSPRFAPEEMPRSESCSRPQGWQPTSPDLPPSPE